MGRKAAWPPKVYVSRRGVEWVRLRLPGGRSRDVTLGPAGSAEARQRYARLLAEVAAGGVAAAAGAGGAAGGVSVAVLCADYLRFARGRYSARQFARIVRALRPAAELYGAEPASAFGPVALRACRETYRSWGREWRKGGRVSRRAAGQASRGYVNALTQCVRRAWRWAASEQTVTHACAAALSDLADYREGEPGAPPDRPAVKAVDDARVEATLRHLGRVVGDMVRLQRLTGMRPGEVCRLTPGGIDRAWRVIDGVPVWLYRLGRDHKTAWMGHERDVPLGPKAQLLLGPYLGRDAGAPCFSPREAAREHHEARRAARKSRPTPRQLAARRRRPGAKCAARYTTQAYGLAVARACRRAGVAGWAPNQLRHRLLTDVEVELGREDARCVGGHSTPQTTARYAEWVERAARVMAKVG